MKRGENMIETKYDLYQGDEFKIEKLVIGKPGQYIHMVFPKGKGLPIHKSNAELFMTVLRGTLSLKLDNQELENIQSGTMIKIPINTLMNVTNQNEKTCELIVVKILPE
jgi:quercetin dioxygenase-like cupin family protein